MLKDVGQLINLTLTRAKNRQPLSGSTTFNRIELPTNKDPLNGIIHYILFIILFYNLFILNYNYFFF